MLHSIYQHIWKTQQWVQDCKRSVFNPKEEQAKECSNFCKTVLISHASKLCSKSFKLGFGSIWTENFQMYKMDLEIEEPEIKLPASTGSQRKQGNSRKISTLPSFTTLKLMTVWITIHCGKFLKRWEYQTTLPSPKKPACGSRSNIESQTWKHWPVRNWESESESPSVMSNSLRSHRV